MKNEDKATERTCIVTRAALPAEAMIRFVVSPDGEVVPDLRRRLPGRGVWVTATAAMVATAERKHLFARGFGEAVRVEPGLAERVGDRLRELGRVDLAVAVRVQRVPAGVRIAAAGARDLRRVLRPRDLAIAVRIDGRRDRAAVHVEEFCRRHAGLRRIRGLGGRDGG